MIVDLTSKFSPTVCLTFHFGVIEFLLPAYRRYISGSSKTANDFGIDHSYLIVLPIICASFIEHQFIRVLYMHSFCSMLSLKFGHLNNNNDSKCLAD